MSKLKTLVVVALAAVAVVASALVIRPIATGPPPMRIEDMPELPLPADPIEAYYTAQDRQMQDMMSGIDRAEVQRRHKERLRKIEEMKQAAARGDGSQRQR